MFDDLKVGQKTELLRLIPMDQLLERPLVCIKPYKGNKSGIIASAKSYFQGKPTDSFWPDWTDKYPAEKAASDQDANIFNRLFGFPMDAELSDLERANEAVKQYAKEGKRRTTAYFSQADD
jgi:hypothetical protein